MLKLLDLINVQVSESLGKIGAPTRGHTMYDCVPYLVG